MATDENPVQPQPAGTGDTKRKHPKRPFDTASKVVRLVQLESIRFGAFSAQALESAAAIHPETVLSASSTFLRPIVTAAGDGFTTKTTLLFRVAGAKPSDDTQKPYAVVRATIEVDYLLEPDRPELSDEDLRDFALCYCPFHVWGYWREFVQSSLGRLEFPPFTLPLFVIAQAPAMVRETLD